MEFGCSDFTRAEGVADVGEVEGVRTLGFTGGILRSSMLRNAAKRAECERWAWLNRELVPPPAVRLERATKPRIRGTLPRLTAAPPSERTGFDKSFLIESEIKEDSGPGTQTVQRTNDRVGDDRMKGSKKAIAGPTRRVEEACKLRKCACSVSRWVAISSGWFVGAGLLFRALGHVV